MEKSKTSHLTRRNLLRGAVGVATTASTCAFLRNDAAQGAAPEETKSKDVEIHQITTNNYDQSNIYGERSWCTPDSRYFVYERENPLTYWGANQTEYMVVELGTWKQHLLDVGTGRAGCAIHPDGTLYYLKYFYDDNAVYVMRAGLSGKAPEKLCAPKRHVLTLGTVSPDHRYYAYGSPTDDSWTHFGVFLLDLENGQETTLDVDPCTCNPHPHFEPGGSGQLMIQWNRGSRFNKFGGRAGTLPDWKGPKSATLFLLSVPDGKRTELKIGEPYTTGITGHEAWIGETKEIAATVVWSGNHTPEKGNLLAVGAGKPARVIGKGYRFNHLHISPCARFFVCDDWRPPYKLIMGSIKTGKTTVLCEQKLNTSTPGYITKMAHGHQYLTPDLKWLIFNSNQTGYGCIYAARVPEDVVKNLL